MFTLNIPLKIKINILYLNLTSNSYTNYKLI